MDSLNAEYCLKQPQVRQFLHELILESCGFDLVNPIPTGKILSEYEQGKMKIAIDVLNLFVYDNLKSFIDLKKEINLKQQEYSNE